MSGVVEKNPLGRVSLQGLVAAATSRAMLLALAMAALAVTLGTLLRLPSRANRWDFSIYYISALSLREGRNPYAEDLTVVGTRLGLDTKEIKHATDPPTFLLVFAPLTLMSPRVAYWTWIAFNALLLAGAFFLLLANRSLSRHQAWALALLAILYPPMREHFLVAQSKLPLLFLLVFTMRSLERGHDLSAGFSLALAGLLRLFPLLLIGYLVLQRRWRPLLYTLLWIAVGATLTVVLAGPTNTVSFARAIPFLTNQYWLMGINLSLAAFVSRLFWYVAGLSLGYGLDVSRRLAVGASQLVILTLIVKATLALGEKNDPEWGGFSMWVIASVMLSPIAWVHDMVLMLIPLVQIAMACARSEVRRASIWLAIASYLFVLLAEIPPLVMALLSGRRVPLMPVWQGLTEACFLSLLLLLLATVFLCESQNPRASTRPSEAV